jgi:hypothetical protein
MKRPHATFQGLHTPQSVSQQLASSVAAHTAPAHHKPAAFIFFFLPTEHVIVEHLAFSAQHVSTGLASASVSLNSAFLYLF